MSGTGSEATSIGAILRRSTDYLIARGSETPRLDAERLLSKVLGCERIDLYMALDRPLTPARDRRRPRARRQAWDARAAPVRPRRVGLSSPHPHRRRAGAHPATRDGDPRRQSARADGGEGFADGARRRDRIGRDRTRDRRRAPGSVRDGLRPLGRGARPCRRERGTDGPHRDARPRRSVRGASGRPVGHRRLESAVRRCVRDRRPRARGAGLGAAIWR